MRLKRARESSDLRWHIPSPSRGSYRSQSLQITSLHRGKKEKFGLLPIGFTLSKINPAAQKNTDIWTRINEPKIMAENSVGTAKTRKLEIQAERLKGDLSVR